MEWIECRPEGVCQEGDRAERTECATGGDSVGERQHRAVERREWMGEDRGRGGEGTLTGQGIHAENGRNGRLWRFHPEPWAVWS